MFKRILFIVFILYLSVGAPDRAGSNDRSSAGEDGIWDGCTSSAHFLQSGSRCLIACPQGGGSTLAAGGNEIVVTVRDFVGQPIPNIPASDFWLFGCSSGLQLCGGGGSIDADSSTNAAGQTTISGRLAAGGCDTGVMIVVWGVILGCPPICLSLDVRSPDLDADLDVDLVDFSLFAPSFPSPPSPYNSCCDYDCDGDIDLVDFSIFAQHWQHHC